MWKEAFFVLLVFLLVFGTIGTGIHLFVQYDDSNDDSKK